MLFITRTQEEWGCKIKFAAAGNWNVALELNKSLGENGAKVLVKNVG